MTFAELYLFGSGAWQRVPFMVPAARITRLRLMYKLSAQRQENCRVNCLCWPSQTPAVRDGFCAHEPLEGLKGLPTNLQVIAWSLFKTRSTALAVELSS